MATILVVDDDAGIRRIVEAFLKRGGHEVVTAVDGADAMRQLDKASFDLVVTDVVMPNAEGLELMRNIRRRPSRPGVIAMSGGGRVGPGDYLALAKSFGAAEILRKPFTLEQLDAAVETVLREQVQP